MKLLKTFAGALAGVGLLCGAALAQDAEGAFAEGSEARSWNLLGQEFARFEGRVVDVLCEVAGDCAENCGDGRRQLGILRSADDALLLVSKNTQANFAGGVIDLLPYCNEAVEVDGLLVGAVEGHAKLYQPQRIRRLPDGEWARTNQFSRWWNRQNPELREANPRTPWFRLDTRVTDRIAAEGYLGLGLEVDREFIELEYGE